ncbi:uncharacterized protein PFL1_03761 [Pseudozyma flocculosa PF-1]|uniref:DNA mismatch repair protein PMS1 n=2 Tax=Pseudozyma flocculosa TaxID=84751 RepID=A0A5C3EXN5_9BASI|nr:uncharacterized protein PFL1_03761 [Pseudozyma flocculosa PF-1]EPQ28458.1 hypothetical protein PFL1_03761 [Pseudozyma flocculosa PF-1]SPO36376.1 related to PMS1 - DNA mismatch repair protein [Pseudozyma flocculosa]
MANTPPASPLGHVAHHHHHHEQQQQHDTGAAIRPIAKADVHRITSGQVVLDLQTAVKELVENALDAGATNIEVRFRDYGADAIEVIDNGSGIDPSNYDGIALKHHTSKLASFSDLAMVQTFGFRGEALSSLCALSQVVIHTATSDDAPVGTIIELDHAGCVSSREKKAARQRGTTVTVTGLFKSLPVRRKEFEKNLKREFAKAQSLLQAYALISRGVRWTSSNQPKAGRRTPQFSVNSSASDSFLVSNVSSLFGARVGPTLMPLDLTLSFAPIRSRRDGAGASLPVALAENQNGDEDRPETDASQAGAEGADDVDDAETTVKVVGVISKPTHGNGRTSSDRQFFYINGRPWEAGRISRAFNEVYRSYNASQLPFVIADFRLPTDSYDVNVSPDKRTIFLHEEARLIEKVRDRLDELFAPTRGVFKVGDASQSSRALATQTKLAVFAPSASTHRQPSPRSTICDGLTPEADGSDATSSLLASEQRAEESQTEIERRPPSPMGAADDSGLVDQDLHDEHDEEGETSCDGVQVHDQDDSETDVAGPSGRQQCRRDPLPSSPRRDDGPAYPKRLHEPTMDTTRASWSPVKRLRLSPPPEPSSPSLDDLLGSSSQSSPSAGKHKRARVDLIRSLTSYALPGSQIAEMLRTRQEDAAELDDLDLQRLEYAEEAGGDEDRGEDELSSMIGDDVERQMSQGLEPTGAVAEADRDDQLVDDGTAGLAASDTEERIRNLAALDATQGSSEDEHALEDERLVASAASDADEDREPTIAFDLGKIRKRIERRSTLLGGEPDHRPVENAPRDVDLSDEAVGLLDAGVDNVDAVSAEASLNRVIHKSDFASMEVIGQFNLGFIIARRRLPQPMGDAAVSESTPTAAGMDDLFIVDQHASDEKFNFETLQLETRVQSQRLILPRPLELSASDELVASEHIETLKRNGFEIEVEENGLPGRRVRLVAQPVSKGTVFGVKDLEELLYLLRDITPGSSATLSVRCTKARAMFASRACRKSVMIGTALQKRQMKRILEHMGEIEQPWNCPHGRPTMRHLACLQAIDSAPSPASARHASKRVDWGKVFE